MAWYKSGTVTVTKGQTSVTGVGTRWASNARVGDSFRGPDGYFYEIVNIASETVLGILPAYQGDTVANSANYSITPIQGYVKDSADRLRFITDQIVDISQDVADAEAAARASEQSAVNALASETAAKASETAAKTSETNAKTSETNAKTSETAAKASQTAAAASQTAAKTSETNSKNSETAAKTSETNASNSAGLSAGSAAASATSATNAKNSEDAALASKNTAAVSAAAAAASESAAKTAQTAADASKTAAAGSATAAATSATNASTARTGAQTAETNAKGSETKAKAWATNPEDSAVETGMYSALHWAAKAKASADLAAGATGARLTSIASAVMAVNDMLIADTTTTMTKIATGTNGRALLGGETPAANRTTLGLGTSATYDVNTTTYQTGVGGLASFLMRAGSYGLGSVDLTDLASGTDLNTVNATGFYQTGPSNLNTPGVAGQMIVMTNAQYYTSQILCPQDNTGRLFVRSSVKHATNNEAVFGPWNKITSDSDVATILAAAGWGATTSTLPTLTNIDDATTKTGLYIAASASTGTKPTGQTLGMILVTSRVPATGASGRAVQTWYNTDSVYGDQWSRTYFNGTWGDWQALSPRLLGFGIGPTSALTAPSFIVAGTNLNDMQTSGSWYQSSNTNATLALNYPVVKAGTLFVQYGGNSITTQQYVEYDTGITWSRARFNTTWSTWRQQWDSVSLVKTSSTTDSTAGRMLKVGDFGLGNIGIPPTITNLNDTTLATGFYRIANYTPIADLPAMPNGTYAGTYGLVRVERYSVDYFKMWYSPNLNSGPTGGDEYYRTYRGDTTTWSPWYKVASSNDMTAWGVNVNIGGSTAGTALCANVDDFDLRNGLYACDGTTTGTKPGTQTWGTLLVMGRNFTTGRVVQVWNETDSAGLTTRSWRRLNYGRAWGAWVQEVTINDFTSPEFKGTPVVTGTNVMRYINEGSATAPAVITRLDTSNFYFLLTDPSDQRGTFNALRPFAFNITSGLVAMANGATTASPTAGDRSTRVATTTWVGGEIASKENTIAAGTTAQYYRGDKQWVDFNAAVRGCALTGITMNGTAVVAADSVIIGMGKLQGQINAINGDNSTITTMRARHYIDKIWTANASGTYVCSCTNQSTFELTLTGNTTLQITNVPTLVAAAPGTTSELFTAVITVKQGATAYTLTLPANTKVIALGGSISTPGANKQQDYIFTTKDGTNWEVRPGAST